MPPRVRECHEALLEDALTRRVVAAFHDVYGALGYGFVESVYENALAREIAERGLRVVREARAEVVYKGAIVGTFRPDLLVESRVVVELTARRRLEAADSVQLLNFLRAADLEIGLLLHFGPRPSVRRIAAADWRARGTPRSRSQQAVDALLDVANAG